MLKHVALSCAVVLVAMAGEALAVQYPTIDPGYSQQIYTGPLVGGPGLAWTNSGNMLSRNGSRYHRVQPNAEHDVSRDKSSRHDCYTQHFRTFL